MISRPLPASDISLREMHTWSCKNPRSPATESQESSSGHAPGALCCERAPLQNENRPATWSLASVLHWDTGKVKGTPYPACGWTRVRMSNVTKPLSMLATTTAQEANSISNMLAISGFLIPSSVIHTSEKGKHSDLCTGNQSSVYHVLLSHHLQKRHRKDH